LWITCFGAIRKWASKLIAMAIGCLAMISLWFLSQRVLPPVVVPSPFYILLAEVGMLDTWLGLSFVVQRYWARGLSFGAVK
jgi:hypothetical protein